MAFSTFCVAAVPGGCCPKTFRLTRPCMSITGAGVKTERAEATPPGGYDGVGADGGRSHGEYPGSRWCPASARQGERLVPSPATDLGGRRLRRQTDRLAAGDVRLGAGDYQAQRRSQRLQVASAAMGGGTDVRLARSLSPAQHGLRAPAGIERDAAVLGHSATGGPA